MTTPEFIYFDLGKVLVHFDIDQTLEQIARAAEVPVRQVSEALFTHGLQRQFELGQLAPEEFFRRFRESTGTRADLPALQRAATEIFDLNVSILPVVSALRQTRRRMGILSNTCVTHWQYCVGRFTLVRECFSIGLASYQVGMLKPDVNLYLRAAERAGTPPERIMFIDDIQDNVDGALRAGLDAVQYTSARQLADELRRRRVPMNL